MWTLSYNDISLEVRHVETFAKQVVMAGPTYLYTKFHVKVHAIYNPSLNAYLTQGQGVVAVADRNIRNKEAVNTEVTLRHRLMQPRKALIITSPILAPGGGTAVLLRSPVAGTSVDVANGPTPTVHAVTELAGTKTFFVTWECETCVNERASTHNLGDGTLANANSPLLAHEWQSAEDLDQNFFGTRKITGRAVFRRDRLAVLDRVPDDYRTWLFHPILRGFKREGVSVHQLEDGVTYEYQITDKQRYVGWQFVNISDIDVEVFIVRQSPGGEELLAKIAGAAARGLESAFSPFAGKVVGGIQAAGGALGAIYSAIPTNEFRIVVTVTGTLRANRVNLFQAASRIFEKIFSKLDFGVNLFGVQIPTGLPSQSMSVGAKLTQPSMTWEIRRIAGPIGSGLASAPGEKIRLLDDMTVGDNFQFPAGNFNATYPSIKGARGTDRDAVMAAILHDTGDAHTRPEDQRRVARESTP